SALRCLIPSSFLRHPAPTEIYTLSLHDALPIYVYFANTVPWRPPGSRPATPEEMDLCLPFLHRQVELVAPKLVLTLGGPAMQIRSEEHTSELQSRENLVCRLLLEKKKNNKTRHH